MYRILVVDDEAKIRLLIRKYAEFEGHEVTEAENGMEAVRLFRRTPDAFDIVIMDVMMPELDGFSAVAEIKKIASPAVIMLSARGEEYDKIHGFELGVDDYVVKPFSPKELPHSWGDEARSPDFGPSWPEVRFMATLLSFGRSCSCQGALH